MTVDCYGYFFKKIPSNIFGNDIFARIHYSSYWRIEQGKNWNSSITKGYWQKLFKLWALLESRDHSSPSPPLYYNEKGVACSFGVELLCILLLQLWMIGIKLFNHFLFNLSLIDGVKFSSMAHLIQRPSQSRRLLN